MLKNKSIFIGGIWHETNTFSNKKTFIKDFKSYQWHENKNLISEILPNFIGEIYQTPPIYSAIKKNGKRLYELAREGKKTEIKQRIVFVKKFKITKINLPEINFLIECGKGTYIRSIANDFGKALNSGAHLKSLRRISSGKYLVKNAMKFTFN